MQSKSFHEAYRSLLSELMNHGVTETNERTRTQIKMLQGGHSFKLDLTSGRLPIAGNRRYYPHVAAAETAWQFMGTKDPDFIVSKAPKLWSKFVEDGELKTAYGHRWREAFGRDQIKLAVTELMDNPTNRQLFISAWDPSCDGLGGPQPKNIPCPVGFTVSRFGDDLHMSVFIRSSDVFVGLPYDVMCYALTADAIAAEAGLRPATLHVTLAHPHLYEPHWNAVKACLTGDWSAGEWREQKEFAKASTTWASGCEPTLPAWPIDDILENPDGYIDTVRRLSKRVTNNSWDPCPEVIE
ncbi:thymidylate synthase [Roseobacter phage RDJL Phi 2]|uniref:thymidylate synthase n=1 Tax=Roseobacter phage RDJL Phi 2 TaxID=1682380 RepID=A0A0K0PVP0_9CAUD|nr:thymidylate synthase [Roseobacter phage RDJL Phi 2]AKQ75804.1 thymidylate synthase [Roseobacter phage RDJL Phi 2]